MLTGFPPFLADTPNQIYEQIKTFKLNFIPEDWEGRSMESFAFIKRALTTNVEYRMKLSEAFDHPWILQDGSKTIDPSPEGICLNSLDKAFDIFLKEMFIILIDNFDIEILNSLKELTESANTDVAVQIIVNDIMNIVENSETYDQEIKELLKTGLKQLDTHIDCTEFLESVVEEKRHLEQPRFNLQMEFPSSEGTTTSESSTSYESVSPSKRR